MSFARSYIKRGRVNRFLENWSQRWLTEELNHLARNRGWEEAIETFCSSTKNGFVQPNVYHYTTLLSACVKAGHWQKALAFHTEQILKGVNDNERSYAVALEACRAGKRPDLALRLFYTAKVCGKPELNAYCFTAIMSSLAEKQDWETALSILNDIDTPRACLNVFVYTAAIHACSRGNQWKAAMSVFRSMRMKKIEPTTVCFGAIVQCCVNSLHVEKALHVVAHMVARGFPLTTHIQQILRDGMHLDECQSKEQDRLRC